MANLKKKLSLVTGLCILIAFCLTVAASAQDKTGSVSSPASYECTVTVSEGASVNGAEKIETTAFTEVLLSAPSKKGDESFLYWKDTTTNAIVATSRRAYARVYDDTEYVAVYGDPATDEVLNGASTSAFLVVTGETKYLYVSRYVPSDATVVAYGVVYSLVEGTDLADKTVDDFDGETVKLKRHETSAARISTVGYTAEADAVAYRPFVTVRDASGTETVVYGDAVSFTACEDTAHGAVSENVRKDTSTCSVKGTVYYGCGVCGYRYEKAAETVNDEAHLWKKVEAKAATCTEAGNNEYEQCVYCDKTNLEESEIVLEKLSHDYKSVEAKAATCTEAGWHAHRECKTCGHVAGLESDDALDATVAKTEHAMASVEARPATCGKVGYNAHTACSVCGYSEDRVEEPKLTHEFGDAYEVPASYRNAAYSAKDCEICGYCQKTYKTGAENQKLLTVVDLSESALVGTKVTFTANAPLTGLYEIALKLSGTYAHTSEYSSLVAQNGYGSVVRIADTATIADGYSAYVFHVYLEKGENTLTFRTQNAAAKLIGARLDLVTGDALMQPIDKLTDAENTAEEVEALAASKVYTFGMNGMIVTSSLTGTRSLRVSTREFRKGDTLSFEFIVAEDGTYRAYIPSGTGTNKFTLTLKDKQGNVLCDTTKQDGFTVYNSSSVNSAGSASTQLYVSNETYELFAGTTYVVSISFLDQDVLGSIYLAKEQHTHAYTVDVEAKAATCTEAGYEAYKACSVCGKPETELSVIPTDSDNHTWSAYEEKAPTCTDVGYEQYRYCLNEGCSHSEGNGEIPALDHELVDVAAKDATCEENGYNEHELCSVCGYSPDLFVIPVEGHNYGEEVHVEATYVSGGYMKVTCSVCGDVQKTYIEDEPKLSYTASVSASGQNYSFDVTVEDAGVYELALKLTTVPTESGYTSVYAKNGYGSVVRINGSEQDADGYSLYRFYVYLDAGKNTVFVEGQATMAASSVKLMYVTDAVDPMTETFESITKLEASKEYNITNGKIVTSKDGGSRSVRYGILQLRTGDTVTYSLTVNAATSYGIALMSNNAEYTMTIEDASGNKITLNKDSFASANEDRLTKGSESALLWLSSEKYDLAKGTYTVTLTSTGNLILGGVYFSVGEVATN